MPQASMRQCFANTQDMIPDWFHALSGAYLALGAVCFLVIVFDVYLHPQHMWIMNIVWPVTALFGTIWILSQYFKYGRLAGHRLAHEVGNYAYFGSTPAMLRNGVDWLAIPLCGALGGLAGGLFSRIVILMARGLPAALGRAIKFNPIPFALVCGVLVALCGIASGDTIYGTGYMQVKAALEGGTPLRDDFGLFKFLATVLSTVSRRHLLAVARGRRRLGRQHRTCISGGTCGADYPARYRLQARRSSSR